MSPFYVQDIVHIATKLRNWLLRTIFNSKRFPFGPKHYIQIDHLKYLVENIPKDQHELTATILNPIDKQNFTSVKRICDQRVVKLLENHVEGSKATAQFLKIVSDIIESYTNPKLKPIERIQRIWRSVFLIRIWRQFVESKKGLTLKNNFLTQNCYACIEIIAHNILLIMLYLKNNNEPEFFLPHLLSSQPCEAFFRQIRSFTSTYSTVANCTVKEIMGRIFKIQLQNDIGMNTNFIFPGVKNEKQFFNIHSSHELPPMHQIFEIIQQCHDEALNIAEDFGIFIHHDKEYHLFDCSLPSLKIKASKKNKLKIIKITNPSHW